MRSEVRVANCIIICNDYAYITLCTVLSFLDPNSTDVLCRFFFVFIFNFYLYFLIFVSFAKFDNCVTLNILFTGELDRSPVIQRLIFLENKVISHQISVNERLVAHLLVDEFLLTTPYLYQLFTTEVVNKGFVIDLKLNWAIVIGNIIAGRGLNIIQLANVNVKAHVFQHGTRVICPRKF